MIKYNSFSVFSVFFKLNSNICLDFEERCSLHEVFFLLFKLFINRYNCGHQQFYSQKISQRVFFAAHSLVSPVYTDREPGTGLEVTIQNFPYSPKVNVPVKSWRNLVAK